MDSKAIVGPDTTKTYNVAAGGAYTDAAAVGGSKTLPWAPGVVASKAGGSKAYRFVKMTVGAAAAGDMLAFSTAADRYTVIAGTTDLPAAGLCVTAIAQDSYGWIQVAGLNDVAMASDGNVTIDDRLSLTTANDVKPATEAEMVGGAICGTSLAADTGTVLAIGLVRLECPTE